MAQVLTFNLHVNMSHATSMYTDSSIKPARYTMDRPDLVCSLSYGEENVKTVSYCTVVQCPT